MSGWVLLVGLVLAGCGGDGGEAEELGGELAPWAGAQGADERGKPERGLAEIDEWLEYDGVLTWLDRWPCVRHVDGEVPSSGDGLSWDSAFQAVQEGIDAAHQVVEDDPELDQCEVWVAQGTYYIYVNDPMNTVLLESGVALYGGFIGDETRRSERDWESNVTVLSGYDDDGGGMCNDNSSPTVTSCTFNGNSAGEQGGGMYNKYSSPTVTNCILWGDTAPTGPEIYNDDGATPIVTYSDIQGGYTGDGNIDADPLFMHAPDDLHLGAGSPCIDAANGPKAPEYDMDGNPRVDDPDCPNTGIGPPWADMGAYEFQPSW